VNIGRLFCSSRSLSSLSCLSLLILISAQLSSCAANSTKKNTSANHSADSANSARPFNPDPYEKYNRKFFQFNMDLNKAILTPVVNTYNTVLPNPVRNGVRNFSGNIMMVPTIGNDALQANFRFMWRDIFRFALNSTMGCLGLVDVASDIGFGPRTQSFGLTLGKWGIHQSPYVMVPLLGPSTVRGTFGFVPDYFMNPVSYITPTWSYVAVRGVQLLQNASDVLPQEETLMQMSLDPYVAVRSAYLQNRAYLDSQIMNETADDTLMESAAGDHSGDSADSDPLDMENSLSADEVGPMDSGLNSTLYSIDNSAHQDSSSNPQSNPQSNPNLKLRQEQGNLANG